MNSNFEQIQKKPLFGFYQQNWHQQYPSQDKSIFYQDPSTLQYSPLGGEDIRFIQKQNICSLKNNKNKKLGLFRFNANSSQKNSQYDANQNKNSTIGWNNCRILKTYDKISQNYLLKLSFQKDYTKNCLKFTNCSAFNNLQLQQSQQTLKEKIEKSQFSYCEKNKFIMRVYKLKGLKQFLQDILTPNYFQINKQILYFLKILLDFFSDFIQNEVDNKKQFVNVKRTRKLSFEFLRQNLKEEKNKIELQMRELFQNNQLLNNLYYSEHINYLNFKKVKVDQTADVVRCEFQTFMKSLTKIIIKLIAVDLVNLKKINQGSYTNSRQKKQGAEDTFQNIQGEKLKINFINSYRSLNSVASLNLRQFHIYQSKPDLWSDSDSQQNENCLVKKKRKYY